MKLEQKSFPIDSQIGYFKDESEVEKWLLKNKEKNYPHDYAAFIKASQVIYTPKVSEYLLRYSMLKDYNIYSYSQNFDKIPGDWVSMLVFMDNCVSEAVEERDRLGRR